uniref:NADH-quinone oxidoreductase subunit J n=1 Tax=Schlesneria paludicola TaxID=360056 RepID=A0A7C2NXN2_9PLAN
MDDLIAQLPLLIPLVLGGLAVWLLLPRDGVRAWALGGVCGLVALGALARHFAPPVDDSVHNVLFYLFGGGAVVVGTLMITDRNPVYAALWFALVTLCTCGLFLLNSAPFLAAATVIVYAGAIVVTFLFVIMLAQQAGAAGYDRRAFQPELAVIGGCLVLGALLYTLQEWTVEQPLLFVTSPMAANPLSEPQALPDGEIIGESDLGTLRGVGRSLFGDYLFAVELAGTVLLIATIGAIALAPRRSQGTL